MHIGASSIGNDSYKLTLTGLTAYQMAQHMKSAFEAPNCGNLLCLTVSNLISLCKIEPALLRYIDNEEVREALIEHDPHNIKYINDPSEALQIAAVEQNGCAIRYIKNPSGSLQLLAVKHNGYAIEYIKNPSEAVQLAAMASIKPNTLNWSVGYVNDGTLPPEVCGGIVGCTSRRFKTEDEAEDFIEELRKVVPDDVEQGKFFLDGPTEE